MKKNLSLLLIIGTAVCQRSFADTNAATFCDATISIKCKDLVKEFKTNEPINITIQIKNSSTNDLLFRINNLPSDFNWTIISPTGKDVSPKPDLRHDAISGSFPKLKPQELWESICDLKDISTLDETGTYKVIIKKEVFFMPARKKIEIISNPLQVKVSEL
ncbi:MAG TPA: hypothetical protein VFV23_04760 [Verrucomicrobiae bacterium]|nr:hypothetical protein [Verrucomicrobiae bacterium]